MIKLTRIDGRIITINADEIETVESSFDSTVTLKSGKKIIVKEDADTIIRKVIAYRRKILENQPGTPEVKTISDNQ